MAKFKEHFYKCPQGILKIIVQMIRSFLWDVRGRWKKNISKNSFFHGDKRFWPTFPRIIDCGKPQETLVKGPQAILTITVELENAIF